MPGIAAPLLALLIAAAKPTPCNSFSLAELTIASTVSFAMPLCLSVSLLPPGSNSEMLVGVSALVIPAVMVPITGTFGDESEEICMISKKTIEISLAGVLMRNNNYKFWSVTAVERIVLW